MTLHTYFIKWFLDKVPVILSSRVHVMYNMSFVYEILFLFKIQDSTFTQAYIFIIFQLLGSESQCITILSPLMLTISLSFFNSSEANCSAKPLWFTATNSISLSFFNFQGSADRWSRPNPCFGLQSENNIWGLNCHFTFCAPKLLSFFFAGSDHVKMWPIKETHKV